MRSIGIPALWTALWLLVLCPCQPALALDPQKAITQYGHRVWKAQDGLPQDSIQAIAQTPDGYLWLGTRGGLVRFDGLQFDPVPGSAAEGLKPDIINALLVTRDGSLWIGQENEVLTRFKDAQFQAVDPLRHIENGKYSLSFVRALWEGREGDLWVGQYGSGLFHLKGQETTRFPTPDLLVRAVWGDGQGNLWVGTQNGLCRLQNGKYVCYNTGEGLSHSFVQALYQDRRGTLWVGTRGGLTSYQAGRFRRFTTHDGLSHDDITALLEDRDGNLWIGTQQGGLNRLRDGRFSSFTKTEGLSDNQVQSLYEDREGNLWVGTQNGLNRFHEQRFTSYTVKEGLPHENTTSVLGTRDGSIWTFMDGGGVSRLKDGVITSYTSRQGLTSNYGGSLYESQDGSLWVGTDRGLNRIRDGRISKYTGQGALPGWYIHMVADDEGGMLLSVTSLRLKLLRNDRLLPYPPVKLDDDTFSIHRQADGTIWFCTSVGLVRHKQGQTRWYTSKDGLASNLVYSVYEDQKGGIWIATGKGLSLWKDEKLTTFGAAQGLFESSIYWILEAADSDFWISSLQGIYRVSRTGLEACAVDPKKQVSYVKYDTSDGLPSSECNKSTPGAWKALDGRLWFATKKGLVMIDPARVKLNPLAPPVTIEQARIGKQEFDPRLKASVPPGNQDVEVHYAGLSFQAPEKVRFKYLLEGYDRDWVDCGARRMAYYTHLPPRDYRFRVKACNNDGVWNEAGASFDFHLAPYFYQRLWFYLFCVAVVALLGLAVHRFRVRELKARFSAVFAERTRIAGELHDTVEQGLAMILLQLESAAAGLSESSVKAQKHLGLARQLVKHNLVEARRSVLELYSQDLDDADLVEAVSQMASQLTTDTSIQAHIRVTGTSRSLPAEASHHLLRICQEAITNGVKHARASEILVTLNFHPQEIHFSVQDNGCGFDPNSPLHQSGGHFGLLGMRQRAKRLGAALTVQSHQGQGTEILVSIPNQ
jgi:ligand-binding sensor domain-containing protein/signal transduction histidine kinase